jgi:hypothetical protein
MTRRTRIAVTLALVTAVVGGVVLYAIVRDRHAGGTARSRGK